MGRDIAVVTGGVSGIGKAITEGLRAAHFRVAVFDLDADAAVAAAGPDGLGVAVNTRGPFLCARAALPDMLAADYGQIITIASINGLVALPGRCAYTTSKGGALMFAKSLAVDYGPSGIRSNAICPGMIRTPLVAARIDAGGWDLPSLIPLGRPGQPEEIAEAVVLLAAGRLDYMNGSAWVIDGGWTAL